MNIIEEDLITFETAKLAKEIGYMNGGKTSYIQSHTDYIYDDDPKHPESYKKDEVRIDTKFFHINNFEKNDFSNEYFTIYEAPTQSLLQKWLREKHKLFVYVLDDDRIGKYYWGVSNLFSSSENPDFNTYEEALEVGLQQALKFIK